MVLSFNQKENNNLKYISLFITAEVKKHFFYFAFYFLIFLFSSEGLTFTVRANCSLFLSLFSSNNLMHKHGLLSFTSCGPLVMHGWEEQSRVRRTLGFCRWLVGLTLSRPSRAGSAVVRRVLPFRPLPARGRGVHAGPQAHGRPARPPRGRRDGC